MKILHDLLALFFPRLCLLCGELLVDGEKCLCLSCIYKLPRTNYHLRPFNPAEQLFTGKVEIEKATAFLHYEKGGKVQQLIYAIKYKGEKEAASNWADRLHWPCTKRDSSKELICCCLFRFTRKDRKKEDIIRPSGLPAELLRYA